MEQTTDAYSWDKPYFERKISLLTNLQLGFVGAALMLMMMDLSRIYLLAPLAIGLILASWYKHHFESVKEETQGIRLSFAPKSLLITDTQHNTEQRITFRQISDVSLHWEHLISVLTIYLDDDKDKVQLKGLKDAQQALEQLSSAQSTTADNNRQQ